MRCFRTSLVIRSFVLSLFIPPPRILYERKKNYKQFIIISVRYQKENWKKPTFSILRLVNNTNIINTNNNSNV